LYLVLRVYFDTLQLTLHPLGVALECCGRVVEPSLGLWFRLLHQQGCGIEERPSDEFQDLDAARTRQGQQLSPHDAWRYDVFGTIVVPLRAALKEVDLGRFEEVTIHPRPKSAVLLRNVAQTALNLAPHCLEVPAESVDSATERVVVWKRDESDRYRAMAHSFPACKM